jgi:hypothetical protein
VEVVDLPHVASACDKSDNLGEKDSSPVIAVPDDYYKGVIVYGMQIECNLG